MTEIAINVGHPSARTGFIGGQTPNPPVQTAEAVQAPPVASQTTGERLSQAGFRKVRGVWRR